MQVILRFLFAALLCLPGVSAGQSKSEQFLNLTVEVKLGTDDDPGPTINYNNLSPDELKWRLAATSDTWCKNAVKTIFRNSSHPDSNPYQRFNEDNGGIAMVCSEREDSHFYTVIGGVHNSRDGDAVFWGKGVRLKTPEVSGLSVGVGLELNLVYYSFDDSYGYRRVLNNAPPALIAKLGKLPTADRGYMFFPLPILVYQISYSWENRYAVGRISLVERNLAGAAQLRGIEISVRVRF